VVVLLFLVLTEMPVQSRIPERLVGIPLVLLARRQPRSATTSAFIGALAAHADLRRLGSGSSLIVAGLDA
jgi:hypothetical protein